MARRWWQGRGAEGAAPTSRDWVRVRRELDGRRLDPDAPAGPLPAGPEFYPPVPGGLSPARPSWPPIR